jgi:hypothetical protein
MVLALFRILSGAFVLFSALLFAPYLKEFFSNQGYVTSTIVKGITSNGGGGNGFSILFWNDSLGLVYVLYVLFIAACLCYIFGIYSQITAFITYVCYLSFYNRFTLIGYGGSEVLIMTLFFATFIPTDKALIFSWYQKLRGWKKLPQYVAPGWGVRLVQINIAIIYFFASATKIKGATWMDGTELLGVLNWQYAMWNFSWLSQVPIIVAGMNYFAFAAETIFPFLIWSKDTRRVALAMIIMLNIGIALSLQVTFFAESMIACVVLFLTLEDISIITAYTKKAVSKIKNLTARIA